MTESHRTGMDGLLDALVDEIAARLQSRGVVPGVQAELGAKKPPAAAVAEAEQFSQALKGAAPAAVVEPAPGVTAVAAPTDDGAESADAGPTAAEDAEDLVEAKALQLPPRYAARLLGRIALLTLIVTVLINIPINRGGLTLATALPDSAALVIRDGLVVKPAGSTDIYVYQDEKFRWISSLEAFEHYGFNWQQVREVQADFLEDYEIGAPLHVLLKCPDSPHVYRLEDGVKRWVVDIATFTAEGHVWEDVRMISCWDLRSYPDGETIPPGRGPAPIP